MSLEAGIITNFEIIWLLILHRFWRAWEIFKVVVPYFFGTEEVNFWSCIYILRKHNQDTDAAISTKAFSGSAKCQFIRSDKSCLIHEKHLAAPLKLTFSGAAKYLSDQMKVAIAFSLGNISSEHIGSKPFNLCYACTKIASHKCSDICEQIVPKLN